MGAACHTKSKKKPLQSEPPAEPQPQPLVAPIKEEITQIREETQKIEETLERKMEGENLEEHSFKKEDVFQRIAENIEEKVEPEILPQEQLSNLKKNDPFEGGIGFPHYEGDNEGDKEEMRTSLHSTQKARREIFGEVSKGLIGTTRNVGDFDEPLEGEEVF